jgi:putative endonuclease
MANKQQQAWFVYILECSDKTLYTGVTTDLERRAEEHNSGTKGAKYTAARRPVHIVYSEQSPSRSIAQQREHQIKSLSRQQKQALIKR